MVGDRTGKDQDVIYCVANTAASGWVMWCVMQGTGMMERVVGEDWTPQTLPSWLHSIWVGVVDPWFVVFKGPRIWYKTVREIVTIVRMHNAFDSGLMQYGLIRGTKKA